MVMLPCSTSGRPGLQCKAEPRYDAGFADTSLSFQVVLQTITACQAGFNEMMATTCEGAYDRSTARTTLFDSLL